MISIIIPTYNGEAVLGRYSIPSLLKQSISDWEALIINDGSNDNTLDVATKLCEKDSRFRLINLSPNQGLAAALNHGLNKANGEYIFILEHDDIWLPEKLEQQVNTLKNGAFICTANAIIWNTNKNIFTKINGGNFSCLSFRKDQASILFPLPEENKKYLGIEDGIIAAKLEIAKASGVLSKTNLIHIDKVLTIMNSNESTLSGKKDSTIMAKRYSSVIKLYSEIKSQHPELNSLIKFWKKHYIYNLILSFLPKNIKKIIYLFVDKIKYIKNGPKTVYTKLSKQELGRLKECRNSYN